MVSYRGVDYEGSHEPLISRSTFDSVQEVLAAHAASGEKQRIHNHFLKGSIFCKKCGSRLGVMNAKTRHGAVYPYFYCSGRQEKRMQCSQRTLRIGTVEAKVEELWMNEQLSSAATGRPCVSIESEGKRDQPKNARTPTFAGRGSREHWLSGRGGT